MDAGRLKMYFVVTPRKNLNLPTLVRIGLFTTRSTPGTPLEQSHLSQIWRKGLKKKEVLFYKLPVI